MQKLKSVVIFCGSRLGNDSRIVQAVQHLIAMLVQKEITIIYGGATDGLMGIVADTALALGGTVIGVMPEDRNWQERHHAGVTELHIVANMTVRKTMMMELSDAAIILPGGLGTMDEFFEYLTWTAVGIHTKPCILFNVVKYYEPLIELIEGAMIKGYVSEQHRNMMMSCSDPELLIAMMENRFEEYASVATI